MAGKCRNRARFADCNSPLKPLEAGNAPLVECCDLAVQDRLRGVHMMRKNGKLWILAVHEVAVAGHHAKLSVIDVAKGADTVPLDFVEPFFASGRRAAAYLRQHWRDVLGHRITSGGPLCVVLPAR